MATVRAQRPSKETARWGHQEPLLVFSNRGLVPQPPSALPLVSVLCVTVVSDARRSPTPLPHFAPGKGTGLRTCSQGVPKAELCLGLGFVLFVLFFTSLYYFPNF